MRSARLLPSAEAELLALGPQDQRRVLGALKTVRRGEMVGEHCIGEDVPIMQLCVWHYVIVYMVMGEALVVSEIGVYGLRAPRDRIDEIKGHIVDLTDDDERRAVLKDSLELLQRPA